MFCINSTAQNIEQVYTNGGSVYAGYIATQVPGSYIIVNSCSATRTANANDVKNLEYRSVDVASLTGEMARWADTNRTGEDTIEVASFDWKGRKYTDAVVLEKGKKIRFIAFYTDDVKIDWTNIKKIVKSARTFYQHMGIKDIVTLKDGARYEGFIVEQVLGKELRIQTAQHEIHTCDFRDVMSIRTEVEVMDADLSVWVLIPLLDVVELKDGTEIEGFIQSRIMGSHIAIIPYKTETVMEVDLGKIKKYSKVVNSFLGSTPRQFEQVEDVTEPENVATEDDAAAEEGAGCQEAEGCGADAESDECTKCQEEAGCNSEAENVEEATTEDAESAEDVETDTVSGNDTEAAETASDASQVELCSVENVGCGKVALLDNPTLIFYDGKVSLTFEAAQARKYRMVRASLKKFKAPLSNGEQKAWAFKCYKAKALSRKVVTYDKANAKCTIELEVNESGTYVIMPAVKDGKVIAFKVVV